MTIEFNADEVFEMAKEIERKGARFYRLAADGVKDATERRMLLELAAMEDDHERTFASMQAESSAAEWKSGPFDPGGEAVSYLRAFVEGRVFDTTSDPADFFATEKSIEGILRRAIELEKDSILFYLGIKEIVPPRLGKDKVDHVIREEMKHVTLLSGKLLARRGSA